MNTSLKTEEALIYVGPIAGLSLCKYIAVKRHHTLPMHSLYISKVRHPDHTTVIEVDESLFWLQISVKAFWNNAIES